MTKTKTLMLLGLSAACGTVDPVDTVGTDDTDATWTIDHASDGALLGVWGTGPDDVWAVGGSIEQPLVMHNDGTAWVRRDVPGTSLLTNIYGFTANDVYAVGMGGLILHYDGDAWSQIPSGTDATLYGLWGASGEDVWIVGGTAGGTGSAVVLRGTSGEFAPVADMSADLRPATLFKVHGYSPDDVIMVGDAGALRWNGSEWRGDDVPTNEPLRSTWGRDAGDIYAVGGRGISEILHYDGSAWSLVAELAIGWGLSGVFTAPDEPTFAVGGSYVFEVGRDGSIVQPTLPEISATTELHGVWGDGRGTTYAVGGSLSNLGTPSGVILRRH